jgi:hypothetical protein
MKALIRSSTAFLLGSLLVSMASAQDVSRVPLPPNHPLVGTWRVDMPDLKCFEEYEVRADGTKTSVSGEERNEFEFSISHALSPKGYYMWTEKLVKTNGKPDCSGNQGEVGQVAVTFIRLHPSNDKFLLCTGEDFKKCFAEFQRKR